MTPADDIADRALRMARADANWRRANACPRDGFCMYLLGTVDVAGNHLGLDPLRHQAVANELRFLTGAYLR